MPRQTRQQQGSAYQKGYRIGYMTAVRDLADVVSNVVSVGQFHEIAEKWEQLKRKREQEAQNNATHP